MSNLQDSYDPFAGPSIVATADSTPPQREIWTASQLGDDASLAFNESVTVRLRGAVDRAALRAAFADLCVRHEALRTTFSGDGLTLCVTAAAPPALASFDWQAEEPEQREHKLAQLTREQVTTPFDLTAGPLLRAQLIEVSSAETWLVFTAHHIVCDGWSTAVLMHDWAALYEARKRGAVPTLPAAEAFSQYARARAALDASHWAAHEAYWVAQFAGEIPVLNLPTDRPRPPRKTYAAARIDATLEPELVSALRKVGAKQRASLFASLLAGFKALVHRLSGQRDLVVGIPAAGQAAEGHSELVGHCVNMLPLRTQLEPEAPFLDLLQSVRKTLLDAQDHQDFTFGTLLQKLPIERDPSRLPLVSVIFNVDRGMTSEAIGFEGVQAELLANPRAFENFDLFLNAVELDGRVDLECQYNTDLFEAATIHRWLDAYRLLLLDVVKEPATPLSRLTVLSEQDRVQLAAWNASEATFPDDRCLHQLFEQRAKQEPERVACELGSESLSFGELDQRANRVARALRKLGVRRGTLVGLCLERSLELLVGLLGIAKAGAGYVPLDPGYPRERLAFMAEDSQMLVLLSDSRLKSELTLPVAQVLCIDQLDEADGAALPEDDASASPESVAYVIYTSGSTGKPKGVLVPHRAAVNLVSSVSKRPGLTPEDVVLAITTLSFDIAVSETWLPLAVGARIVLVPREVASDGAQLRAVCESSAVTFVDATPATYRLLLAAGWRGGVARTLICTGEAMPKDLAAELCKLGRALWNGYGPTETTVWSTFWQVPADFTRILIGQPVDNTQIYVLDAQRNPVPIGAIGELYIAGQGVSLGYLNRPELSAERFLSDPFSARPARMYRTGDLGRYLGTGELECLGRNDNQVKLRGYRIELGEIDDALAQHPALSAAVVILREDRPGDARLVAYVVGHDAVPQASELRAHLKQTLPDYMVPATFVVLDKLPLTPSGKIDRRALPMPDALAAAAQTEFFPPRDDDERLLAGLWAEALGIARVSIYDDFFALGGHSLLASQILARLRRDHGIELSFRKFFEAPTIAQLAELVRKAPLATAAPITGVARRASNERAPLSLGQERLWLLEQMHPAQRLVHTLPAAWRFGGPLDRQRLQESLDRIAQRQEMLRVTIAVEGNQAGMRVAEHVALPIAFVDLLALPAEQRAQALHEQMRALTAEPFDLERGPLFRSTLFRVDQHNHVYFTLRHNLIWDGWSFDLFLSELCESYGALERGEPVQLPELTIGYGDFVVWQREWHQGPELARQISFWKQALAEPNVDLALPLDRPRPLHTSYAGANVAFPLTRSMGDGLAALGQRVGASPFTVLFAAFSVLLSRYSGQAEVLVGTPVRARNLPEVEGLIGPFINAVLLRARVDANASFLEYLKSARDLTLDAFSHQDTPLELLGARPPLVRAFFSYQDARTRPFQLGACAVTQIDAEPPAAANDLMLWMMERPNELLAVCNYSTEIFDAHSVERLLRSFACLLAALVENPERKLAELPILAAEDALESAALARPLVAAPGQSALAAIADRRRAEPDAVAVSQGTHALSNAALWERASALSCGLRARGVARGSVLALALPRSIDTAVALLGAWLAGCAVQVIDPTDPIEYQRRLLAATAPALVITQAELKSRVAAVEGSPLAVLDELGAAGAEPELPALADVALVTCSLGEGPPRLTRTSHAELAAELATLRALLQLGPDAVLALSALPSSDALALELLLGLSCGQAQLAGPDARSDETLQELVRQAKPACAFGTPDAWLEALRKPAPALSELTAIVLGPLNEPLLESLLAVCRRVLRVDAPAPLGVPFVQELSSVMHLHRLGKPLGLARVDLRGPHGEALPIGVAAQLTLHADGAHPVSTGLTARFYNDGTLEVALPLESELAAAGTWYPLTEVARALEKHPAVRRAYVRNEQSEAGGARLVAYLVADPALSYTESELRRHVRSLLPEAVAPQLFVELGSLPELPSGELDVSKLPSPLESERRRERVAPRSDTERVLAEMFEAALHLPNIGVHDNFFDLGGHSLLCFRVIERIEQRFQKRLSPRTLLLNTLEQVAAELDSGVAQNASAQAAREQEQPGGGLRGRMFKKLQGLLRR